MTTDVCGTCDGSGLVPDEPGLFDRCPTCGGTGGSPEEAPKRVRRGHAVAVLRRNGGRDLRAVCSCGARIGRWTDDEGEATADAMMHEDGVPDPLLVRLSPASWRTWYPRR